MRATSKMEAAAAFSEASGITAGLGHMRRFVDETTNAADLAALEPHPPFTVLARSVDPGGTVLGHQGWVVAPCPPRGQPRG